MRANRFIKLASVVTCIVASISALSLQVSPTGGNASSPLLYGVFYEEIYHSGDGGIYSELIRNRAFQGSSVNGVASTTRNLNYWHPVGNVVLALDSSNPAVSSALPDHMKITVPSGTTSSVGVYNEGFWGMNVTTATRYAANFYLRGNYHGNVICSFYSNTTGNRLGGTTIAVSQTSSNGWKPYTSSFTPSASAPDGENTFRLEFDGAAAAGQSLYLNMISVFQQTFDNRNNGLRMDIANTINSMGTKYLRLPGGNFLEGLSSPYRWKWNETIGPIINRPGHPGVWGDISTDGLGLLEMLQWAKDMNLTPVLGVWAGLYLNGQIVAQADLQPYITDVLNEIEFLTGPTSTKYGALRASLGYSTPFNISYIEIGNEDYLNGGTSSYSSYRFNMFYEQLSAIHPDAKYISTIPVTSLTNPAAGIMQDDHIYLSADSMVSSFNQYDHSSRNHPIFVAEYAAISVAGSSSQINTPTLDSATAEAVFLLGLERNSDVIVGSSYGAFMKNYNDMEPNNVAVIKHTATDIIRSISYYVQRLFASNYGTMTLPVTADTNFGPLYWSVTASESRTTYVKIVNYNGASSTPVTVKLSGSTKTTATLTVLTAPSPTSFNDLGSEVSTWTELTVQASSAGVFNFTLTGSYLCAVLTI